MTVNPERKYLAVSIKHSLPSRGYQMTRPLVLWGRRTEDYATRRSFGGYTTDPEKAELYTIPEWIAFAGKYSDILIPNHSKRLFYHQAGHRNGEDYGRFRR